MINRTSAAKDRSFEHSSHGMGRAMLLLAGAAAGALVVACAPARAHAQAVPGTLVQGDNDALDIWLPQKQRPDGEYTNGLRVSLSRSVAPVWGRLVRSAAPCTGHERTDQRCLTTEFAIAQQIYTPEPAGNEPKPGDRAFAGWLHGDATANIIGTNRLTSFRLEAGFTGRATGAEALQNSFHSLIGKYHPVGWKYQLGFFPAGSFTYTDQLRAVLASSGEHAIVDILPAWSAQAGNSRTSAYGELVARAGYHVSHPWSPAAREREGPRTFGIWLYGGVRESLVAFDQSLDRSYVVEGTTNSVERIPWVRSYQFGIAIRRHSLTISFGGVHDAKEYRTEYSPHAYGTLIVNVDRGL
jgi:lipid A 3-O-deacylase